MDELQVNGELFDANCDDNYRIFVNQGGTSSGKTYCIMQLLIIIAMETPRQVITVVGEDLPNLKVGALRDTQSIMESCEELKRLFMENRTDHYFKCHNGSLIEFKSYDSPQDAKSGKRDYLFINEANGISYDIYWQLAMRTRKKVYLDYNPSARFWVHDKLIGRKDVKLIISDHRGNKFLTEEEHAKIESIDDKELWRVYARGLTGKITGLVFPDFRIVDELPPLEECKMRAYGLDFGYVNDESALEEVRLAHGEIWTDEIIYETGLTNPELSRKFKDSGISRRALIIADCAEMKSIAELVNMGWNVVPSVKGADSINAGIDILHRYKWNVTRRSVGIIGNLKKYKWLVNRDGEQLNKPIDKFNHGVDAVRYVALRQLRVRHTGAAKAVVMEV